MFDARSEQKLKEMAEQEAIRDAEMFGSARCGNQVPTEARPETFTERLRRNRENCEAQARRADELRELEFLLQKNPDIARILDLIHFTGSF